jgi:hypothetical protein
MSFSGSPDALENECHEADRKGRNKACTVRRRGRAWQALLNFRDPATGRIVQFSETRATKRDAELALAELVIQRDQDILARAKRHSATPSNSKEVASSRDELLDGLCGSAGDLLDGVSDAVVTVFAMEPGHGGEVLFDVRSEVRVRKGLFGPGLHGTST